MIGRYTDILASTAQNDGSRLCCVSLLSRYFSFGLASAAILQAPCSFALLQRTHHRHCNHTQAVTEQLPPPRTAANAPRSVARVDARALAGSDSRTLQTDVPILEREEGRRGVPAHSASEGPHGAGTAHEDQVRACVRVGSAPAPALLALPSPLRSRSASSVPLPCLAPPLPPAECRSCSGSSTRS
jgi:hypothetical protein